MLSPDSIRSLSSGLQSLAARAQVQALSIKQRMAAIGEDKTRSPEWITEQLLQLKTAPELKAVLAQGALAWAAFAEELALWRQPLAVLRYLARPSMGAAQAEQVRWGNALSEAQALSGDPAGLQACLDDAVRSHDWPLAYAVLLGRVDEGGMPLVSGSKFFGVPLHSLPLPGIEQVEAAARDAELAKIRLDQVSLELNSWIHNPGPWTKTGDDGLLTSLDLDSAKVLVQRRYEEAKARREQMQRPMTAMERWKAWDQVRAQNDAEIARLQAEIAAAKAKLDPMNARA